MAHPAPALGEEPELMAGPESVHAGVETTRSSNGSIAGKVRRKMP